MTSAAAPSEIELEFAAVTVPSFRNAGFNVGIFSRFALNGASSPSTNFASLPALIAIGVDLPRKQPLACWRSVRESAMSIANSSCACA